MIEEPHPDEPIRFFKDLYAVVVGVGLALAAEQILDLDKSGVPIKWEDVPMFIAWISVALPFAHVFVRYLDLAYRRKDQNERGVRIRAISNIVVGAGQYIWIIALALFLSRPLVFGYSLVLFLAGMIGRELYLRFHPRHGSPIWSDGWGRCRPWPSPRGSDSRSASTCAASSSSSPRPARRDGVGTL